MTGLPERVVEEALESRILHVRPLNGGDVARSFRLDTEDGRTVFAKTHPDPPARFFTTESGGLHWPHGRFRSLG